MLDETRVRELLELALSTDRTPEDVCSEEPELLPEIQRRWRRCRHIDSELKALFPQTLEQHADVDTNPPSIPGYEIEAVLGFGGMGVVYKARQNALGRTVAIKVLLAGDFATGPQRARFLREAEAIAGLSDPAIVQIYDYGHYQGRPYYAMEYIDGGNLSDKLAIGPLPAAEAAHYACDLADAIQQAHASGIVHRDIKPANLLLTQLGKLKVTDFGLARQLDEGSRLTLTGDALGTPSYMSPEQARGEQHRIGAAVDIYAIGAVLYEMLTGRPPFQAETAAETQRQVLQEEPVWPSRLNPAVPFDLQTICMKCLEKTPERRYASAKALADDLRRMLAGKPIAARPIGPIEQAYRWAKRNRTVATVVGAGLVLVMLALIVSIVAASHFRRLARENGELATQRSNFATETEKQRQKAVEAEKNEQQLRQKAESLADELRQTLYLTEMNLTSQAASKPGGMTRLFERLAPWELQETDVREWEWGYLNGLLHQCEAILPAHAQGVQQLELSPTGDHLLTVGGDHRACIWQLGNYDLVLRFTGHAAPVYAGTWSPSGELVATADRNGMVCIWESASGALVRRWSASDSPLNAIAWSPDGKWVATGGNDRVLRIWDANRGERVSEKSGHTERITALDWNADSRRLASSAAEKKVLVWDLESAEPIAVLEGHLAFASDVEWSPDGERLATASIDRSCIIWEVSTRSPSLRLAAGSFGLKAVAWSPDGTLLATCGDDQTTRIWSATDGTPQRTLVGHSREVMSLDWRGVLATGGGDGEVRIWSNSEASESPQRIRHKLPLHCLRWSPVDPKTFVAAGGAGQLLFCSGNDVTVVASHASTISSVVWKPTGDMLATLSHDGTIQIWDAASRTVAQSMTSPWGVARSMDWSPDGQFIATGGADGVTRIWRPGETTSVELPKLPAGFVNVVAWSPDGSLLAVASSSGFVNLYSGDDWQEVREIRERGTTPTTMAWSPDGSKLAIGAQQSPVEVWRIADGERIAILHGNRSHPAKIAWNPSGRRIATAGRDGSVRVWDVESSREVIVFSDREHSSDGVDWSCDGYALASCGNSDVMIYDAWSGFFAAKSPHLLSTLNRRLEQTQEVNDLRSRGLVYSRMQDETQASRDLREYLTRSRRPWIIADCYVAGPYSIAFDQVGSPESGEVWSSNPLRPSQDIAWRRVPLRDRGFINFGRLFDGKGNISGYAYLPVYCLEDRDALLRLGSDDQMRVWVNDRLIHESRHSRTAIPDQDQVPVRFREGWNRILVRVANERNNHILYFEIDDAVIPKDAHAPASKPSIRFHKLLRAVSETATAQNL